jgi:hypothetical protein
MSTPTPVPTPTGVPTDSKGVIAARDAQAAAKAQANTQWYDPENPPIYLGRESPTAPLMGRRPEALAGESDKAVARGRQGVGAPKVQNYNDVVNQFYLWDDATKQKFRSQLALTGADVQHMNDAQLQKAWSGYVAQSGAYWQNGNGKGLTPWDVMSMDMANREKQGPIKSTSTNTSTALDISTREDANYIAQQAARSLLGRDPTQQEISRLLGTLNQYERDNPRVTTSTQTSTQQPGGDTTSESSSTAQGGVSAEARNMLAQQQLKQGPEYGAYQAATTYFNDLMQVLGRGY